jgi:hypothetical protein
MIAPTIRPSITTSTNTHTEEQMALRIYSVKRKTDGSKIPIKAASRAQARAAASRLDYVIDLPSQEDLMEWGRVGATVIDADNLPEPADNDGESDATTTT